MLENSRYGLGRIPKSAYIDDATLYVISQYCSELVSTGMAAPSRATCNLAITSQQEAYKAVNDMATIFRGLNSGRQAATFPIPLWLLTAYVLPAI